MKRPAFIGFSEDSEVAEEAPLKKRNASSCCSLLLIQLVRCQLAQDSGVASSLDRQRTEFNDLEFPFFVFRISESGSLSVKELSSLSIKPALNSSRRSLPSGATL
jgi:hypothetical protein